MKIRDEWQKHAAETICSRPNKSKISKLQIENEKNRFCIRCPVYFAAS